MATIDEKDASPPSMMLYNIFHHKLFDAMYDACPEILSDVTFFGVNQKYPKLYNEAKGYRIVWEWDLPHYRPEMQADGYCQTSALYHVYQNKLHLPYDYIGCLQYDMKFRSGAKKSFATEIEECTKLGLAKPFFYSLKGNLHLWCNGLLVPYTDHTSKTCLAHYNKFHGTSWTVDDLVRKGILNNFILLHTFVIPRETFARMMAWMSDYIATEFIEFQRQIDVSTAEFLERVHALFLAIEIANNNHPMIEMPIEHIWPMLHDQTEWHDYKKPLSAT